MQWNVFRLFDKGVVRGPMVQGNDVVRSGFRLDEEHHPSRHRTMRLARLFDAAAAHVPPLWDAQMIAARSQWIVSGFETLPARPLQHKAIYAQTWVMTPAPDDDRLIQDREIARLRPLEVELGSDPRRK